MEKENEQRRRGHWTRSYLVPGSAFVLAASVCSECRRESIRLDIDQIYNYCPYCGASMNTKRGEKF